ncbi:MAG: hypothetical protein UIC63_03340 [Bacteroidaceae bacterium]|nr:hypothetical protein [Bacteroidaceae bacterium]
MDRRNFIKASIGAAIAAQMPLGSVAQTQKPQIARKVSEMKKLSLRSVRIYNPLESSLIKGSALRKSPSIFLSAL